jgi:hypothetical protein
VPEHGRKSAAKSHTAFPKAQRAGPFAEEMDLCEGWNHVVLRGPVVKATTTPPPNPHPSHQPVTEALEQPKVTREAARPKTPYPKSTAAPKPAAGKPKKKAAASVEIAATKITTTNLVVPAQIPTRGNL